MKVFCWNCTFYYKHFVSYIRMSNFDNEDVGMPVFDKMYVNFRQSRSNKFKIIKPL